MIELCKKGNSKGFSDCSRHCEQGFFALFTNQPLILRKKGLSSLS